MIFEKSITAADLVDEWVSTLDNMGPFAPRDALIEHLDHVPPGVDPELLELVEERASYDVTYIGGEIRNGAVVAGIADLLTRPQVLSMLAATIEERALRIEAPADQVEAIARNARALGLIAERIANQPLRLSHGLAEELAEVTPPLS
jgi:hypothetical protein